MGLLYQLRCGARLVDLAQRARLWDFCTNSVVGLVQWNWLSEPVYGTFGSTLLWGPLSGLG
jgi:hypothetical protein